MTELDGDFLLKHKIEDHLSAFLVRDLLETITKYLLFGETFDLIMFKLFYNRRDRFLEGVNSFIYRCSDRSTLYIIPRTEWNNNRFNKSDTTPHCCHQII